MSICLATGLAFHETKHRQDPLKAFRWAGDSQKKVAEYVSLGMEVHHRAAGYSGKTRGMAAWVVAFCRGMRELDGVKLPVLARAATGTILVPSYKQQVESSQKAYLELLGDWPHEISWLRSGVVDTLLIQPDNAAGTPSTQWSKITFRSQESGTPDNYRGQREDFCHADEPPVKSYWDEALKNARFLCITETPIKKSDWEWIKERFEGTLNRPASGRVEVLSRLRDNGYLSPQKIEELTNRFSGNELEDAYLLGEYVDLEGTSPFAQWYKTLTRWKERVKPAKTVWLTVRVDNGGSIRLPVEVWEEAKAQERYYIPLDPSRGLPGSDPACIHVWRKSTSTLVARFGHRADLPLSGKCTPYTLGSLGAALHRIYNQALTEPEITGGWGDAVLLGLRQNGCGNIGHDGDVPSRKTSKSEGFETTGGSKPLYMAAIQRALDEDSATIYSADCLASISNIRQSENGRWEEVRQHGSGKPHGEDVILAGRALHVIGRFGKGVPKPVLPYTVDDFMQRAMGKISRRDYPYAPQENW